MRKTLTALVCAAVAAGCADDPSVPDSADALDADIALVAADQTMEDIGALRGVPGGDRTWTGEFSRTVRYFDADGEEQDGYDPLTTDVITIEVDASRDASRDGWEASFDHHREFAISGLEGEETTRTWNGAGETAVSRSRHSDADGDRSYDMNASSLMEDVVVGLPRSEHPWPLSGTVTHSIEATWVGPDGERTRSRTVTITFDGTQFAELTVDGETFELDLDARATDRPFRRR
ncbi:MAG TPA: hypothetical protein VK837_05885 [Longimicrobiales bacterium]|nr:hypothetical protein [Longimicrobiales bacterium]